MAHPNTNCGGTVVFCQLAVPASPLCMGLWPGISGQESKSLHSLGDLRTVVTIDWCITNCQITLRWGPNCKFTVVQPRVTVT